jgi:hypothetical protein
MLDGNVDYSLWNVILTLLIWFLYLDGLREVINKGQYEMQGIREEKSAQQQVFILQLALETEATRNRDSLKEIIACIDDVRNDEPQDNNWSCTTIAIQSGRNRLVLLIWSGGVVDHNGGICIGIPVPWN